MDAFADLTGEWIAMESRGEVESIFQSQTWNDTWWNIYGEGKGLSLWKGGNPGAEYLVPFYRISRTARRIPGLKWSEIRLIGTGESVCTDYPDVLGRREDMPHDLLVQWEAAMLATGTEWDLADLRDVRPDSRAGLLAYNWHGLTGNPMIVTARYPCPYVLLPETFEEYREKHLSRNTRSVVNNKWNRMNKDFKVDFLHTGNCTDTDRLFGYLVGLHQARWGGEKGGGNFSDPKYLEFHKEMARRGNIDGTLFLGILLLDDKPVAANYGYIQRGAYYFYQSGLQSGYDRYSPGLVFFYKVIEELYRRDVRAVDFLRGDESYKFHFANRQIYTLRFRIYNRNSRKAHLMYVLDTGRQMLRRYLRGKWDRE